MSELPVDLWVGCFSRARGHDIAWVNDALGSRYVDAAGQRVEEPYDPSRPETERPCVKCHRKPTSEGHDACLGTLPGVRFACCGHGFLEDTYVAFEDDRPTLYGEPAAAYFESLNVGEAA